MQGEGIYAYVILRNGAEYTPHVHKEMVAKVRIPGASDAGGCGGAIHAATSCAFFPTQVRAQIGAIATPDAIQVTTELPKTRSGKIMRRVLRKVAAGETEQSSFGDTSTLADPTVVTALIAGRVKHAEAASGGSGGKKH